MTRKVSEHLVIIEGEPDGVCELCGATDELRPYGPNNERICFDCAMKDKATTDRKFDEMIDGSPKRSDA